jgi:hypothetical protein
MVQLTLPSAFYYTVFQKQRSLTLFIEDINHKPFSVVLMLANLSLAMG